jgi:hypothetical protein
MYVSDCTKGKGGRSRLVVLVVYVSDCKGKQGEIAVGGSSRVCF